MIGNTPLEVAKALYECEMSFIECWVSSSEFGTWFHDKVRAVNIISGNVTYHATNGLTHDLCSLTDPNKTYPKAEIETVCCPDCYGDGEVNANAVDANDRYLCDRCNGTGQLLITEPQTRTMTALEMVRHVEKNRGILVYQRDDWPKKVWVSDPSVESETEPSAWHQALIDDPNFPTWEKLPKVES